MCTYMSRRLVLSYDSDEKVACDSKCGVPCARSDEKVTCSATGSWVVSECCFKELCLRPLLSDSDAATEATDTSRAQLKSVFDRAEDKRWSALKATPSGRGVPYSVVTRARPLGMLLHAVPTSEVSIHRCLPENSRLEWGMQPILNPMLLRVRKKHGDANVVPR